jgi:hypothetical protein
MKPKFLLDFSRGVVLALIGLAILGYFVGLRILNWNPELWLSIWNVIGLLIFTTGLYAVLGVVIGILFSLFLKLTLWVTGLRKKDLAFIKTYLVAFSGILILVMAFLTITRTQPGVHIVIYDTALVVIYCIVIILMFWFIGDGIIRRKSSLSKALILPLALIFIGGLALSYFATSKKSLPIKGDPREVAEALSSAKPEVKAFVLGIDGGEWSIIDKLLAEERMPNLASVIQRGVRARFESLPVLKSPLIWNSIATGKIPAKHGIQDFGSFQFPLMKASFIHYPDGIFFYRLVSTLWPQADMPVTSTTRKVEAIWDLLSVADKKVGVVGWWGTWPADSVNGYIVSDRFTYSLFNQRSNALGLKEGQVYPPEMLEEMLPYVVLPDCMTTQELGRFINGEASIDITPVQYKSIKGELWNPLNQLTIAYTSGESYFQSALHLIDEDGIDFCALYLEGVDMVSHFFWEYMEPEKSTVKVDSADIIRFKDVIPNFYCYTDSLLGELLKRLDANTYLFIVSDHGFASAIRRIVPYHSGEHQPIGIFIVMGPGIKNGVEAPLTSVLDVTPTLLYIYGLPVAKDMDGVVMEGIFTEDYIKANPLKTISTYETGRRSHSRLVKSSADDQIKEQLKSLGYVK